MASPFQQQARQRKLIYGGLILALFTLSVLWRHSVINAQASQLAIREESRGDVELVGSVVRQGLTGSRGLVICLLWNQAIDRQKKNQWNELEVYVRALTKLQPHFITPWLFQSWNLAYNVSVESDRVRDKYFYVTRGVELLAEGERQNRYHPDLRWSIGFYTQHKICMSDETNYQRSLFQLSLIPTNERDPARFQKQTEDGGEEFNWVEFHKFCQDHPQLVRRLREGMSRETLNAKKQQFTCENPEAVVQFLADNFQVPSMYRFIMPPGGADAPRTWDPNKKDELLAMEERFPPLPPRHAGAFDAEAMTDESTPHDETDAYTMAHSWFCYSVEPLPEPDELPGNSKPITDPSRTRLPRNMTTLIFRNYPAQGRRFMAERLQQEGWYDEELWDVSDWFEQAKGEMAGKIVKVGDDKRKWSEDAWKKALDAWRKHGEDNHIILPPAVEQTKRDLAERFTKRHGLPAGSTPRMREEDIPAEEVNEYRAAKYMAEYMFYRSVSNFPHHYTRAKVEAQPTTIACRKLFYKADELAMAGKTTSALEKYETAVEVPAWSGRKFRPLDAWRELVLLPNKDYRRDTFNQEQCAEHQIRYMLLFNRFDGRDLKEKLGKMATVLPLVPKFTNDTFRPFIFLGPLDRNDDEGEPLIEEIHAQMVLTRMGLPTRKKPPTTAPPTVPPTSAPMKRPGAES